MSEQDFMERILEFYRYIETKYPVRDIGGYQVRRHLSEKEMQTEIKLWLAERAA